MNSFKTLVYKDKDISYTGPELRAHWIYETFGLLDNALVAFVGPAQVTVDHMVDLEDRRNNAPIASDRMLHFLGEIFSDSLTEGIWLQQLLVLDFYELVMKLAADKFHRRGNDVFFENRKMSVSIATRTPVSAVWHLGINVTTTGTPLPTSGLQELGLDPYVFAETLMAQWQEDLAALRKARVKVLPR